MKKSFLLVLAAAGVLAACNNADNDARVSQLEQRVTALENTNSQALAQPSIAQPVSHNELDVHAEDAAQPKVEGPVAQIQYKETEYDFGTIKDGEIVTHTFTFTNTGDVPLVIQNASATCGCTVPKKPEKPIAPGQTGEIQVRFDSSNKPGPTNKVVTVTANTEPAISKLTIKGTVTPKAPTASIEGPVKQ